MTSLTWNYCFGDGHANAPLELGCIIPLISQLISIAFYLSGAVALILIIVAGIRYIVSGGGKEAEAAQKMLTYAIIGLVVVLFSSFIINFITRIIGAPCILKFGFDSCQ